jgi:hypothetical protein
MRLHLDLIAACFLLAACSPEKSENAAAAAAARRAAPQPPLKPASCTDKVAVELDRASLSGPSQAPIAELRLIRFRGQAATAFHAAADEACRSTPAVKTAFAAVRRVIVQSGSGAADPTFFQLDEGKPDTIVFQWAFNEASLAVPERKDIATGLRCWADRDRAECADLLD